MIATVQKWGNSLGVRIPKPLAQDAALKEGTAVQMNVQDGRLVLEARKARRYDLSTLLQSVTRRNVHKEIDTGAPVGKEVW
ncbi:MAG TPA: AbrB/MazE/SpoVT family DNA-binding domain-containing protein [Kiritimatiellia bacterium]|nr:AbrB/MazE/SpoVT family DNA-binding domain-containing protein [Kiritimatiellia bacterium]